MKINQVIFAVLCLFIAGIIGPVPSALAANNGGISTKTDVQTVTGEGEGGSREEAVANAIAEAISQLNGVTLSKRKISETLVIDSTAGNSMLEDRFSVQMDSITRGRLNSYRVENVSEYDGIYTATITATKVTTKTVYKEPGLKSSSRRKIAVLPFYTDKYGFETFEGNINSSEITRSFTQAVVSGITQSRRFVVLDRENEQAYDQEARVVLSSSADPKQAVRLGKKLGADYLLVGNVVEFSALYASETGSLTGQTSFKLKVAGSVQYRLLMMSTQQVKWSNTTHFDVVVPHRDTNLQILLSEGLEQASLQIVNELIENIYPMLVAGNSNSGEVILNQGGNTVKVGDRYDVFAKGKVLVDHYSGESLGYDESLVGTIEISRVLPKMSYARVIEGGRIQEGMICRRAQASGKTRNSEEGSESNTTINQDGTIKLF